MKEPVDICSIARYNLEKELPLPAEAIDLYSLDERTQVEYNFTLYESGLFFSSVRYAAVIERSIDAEAHFK